MLKYSLGVPKKPPTRLERVPTVADLQQLAKRAEMEMGKDHGIAWTAHNIEFKLFVRCETPKLLWRLWNSTVPENTPPWTSAEKNPRIVHKQIEGVSNELAGVKIVRSAAPAPPPVTREPPPVVAPGQDNLITAIGASPSAVEALMLERLAKGTPHELVPFTSGSAQEMTAALSGALMLFVRRFAADFNQQSTDRNLHIYITDAGIVKEFDPPEPVIRWRVSTTNNCISVRARTGLLEFFLLPLADAISLGAAQHEINPAARFVLADIGGKLVWTLDRVPISAEQARHRILLAIGDLIQNRAESDEQARRFDIEKRNMAQRIVSQQEEVQRRIARDLHDAVIADITLLKRAVLTDTVSRDQAAESLDRIAGRLREICYELSPSDLKDWGLQTTIEALLEQVANRTGARCMLNCDTEIPSLDSFVELHIFRIIQEALNNAAKYSGANQIAVNVELKRGWLSFQVRDNGRGFDAEAESTGRTKDGGMGRTSMQERVELIRTLFPARLDVASEPGKGTSLVLFLKIRN